MSNLFDIYESGQTALAVDGEQISLLPLSDPSKPEPEAACEKDCPTIFDGQASLDV